MRRDGGLLLMNATVEGQSYGAGMYLLRLDRTRFGRAGPKGCLVLEKRPGAPAEALDGARMLFRLGRRAATGPS